MNDKGVTPEIGQSRFLCKKQSGSKHDNVPFRSFRLMPTYWNYWLSAVSSAFTATSLTIAFSAPSPRRGPILRT